MALSEFDIIARYFNQPGLAADPSIQHNVVIGIGDDAAVVNVPRGKQLVLSMDVLVADVHFPAAADPALIAQRSLAVNLSDLAAMGAEPLCFTLGLTLPEATPGWLQAFSEGLTSAAQQYDCPLVGGNISRGPLQIAIQVQGLVPRDAALLRSGARAGHDVYVSGEPGRAGLALQYLQGKHQTLQAVEAAELEQAYFRPQPRLALGQGLRGLAGAVQDVSDGLLADLAHLARQSRVGMEIEIAALPLSRILSANLSSGEVFPLVLNAGDDYELVFTAPASKKKKVAALSRHTGVLLTRIGRVVKGEGVTLLDLSGMPMDIAGEGYLHFRAE